ncbi:MAG: ring-1,2-phenylacetyl-CoA epoxidase subunit PaaC [Thalassomonas sp.]|jgi:ring-1,2-phenylacetyl-CoA epoxidase subunit PaaC|tara:strand:+ start:868 stop:1614 length:747 start_codon:yes stop_codon:yes gene_type:complete
MNSLFTYTLRIADSSLILGQRMGQWCSKGPTLEEDIAMSNIALDMFGQANGFYEYASQLEGTKSADDLAFKRNEREFFNHQMVEIENGHFGNTIVRNFLHDAFNFLFYTQLANSKDETLSALAAKSLKEVKYHLRHTSNWLIRLGDGTEESNTKVQESLEEIWQYTAELFEMDEIDTELLNKGIAVDNTSLQNDWNILVNNTLAKAKLTRPTDAYMATGGKKGLHTEYLGFILAEMQFLQRAYPDARW